MSTRYSFKKIRRVSKRVRLLCQDTWMDEMCRLHDNIVRGIKLHWPAPLANKSRRRKRRRNRRGRGRGKPIRQNKRKGGREALTSFLWKFF